MNPKRDRKRDPMRLYDYPPHGDWSDDRPIFTVQRHPGSSAEQKESGDRCREAHERYSNHTRGGSR